MLVPRLLLVTDRHIAEAQGRELAECIEGALSALPPAAAIVQLREKDLEPRALYTLTRHLLRITRRYRCPLLVNDRLDVALAAGADGVHLPEAGLPIAAANRLGRPSGQRFIIGRSVHSADGAGAAARDGADVIVCGPIWPTPSKDKAPALGLPELKRAARAVENANDRSRLFAIGGVSSGEQVSEALATGAHGAGCIRAWLQSGDSAAACKGLYEAMSDKMP